MIKQTIMLSTEQSNPQVQPFPVVIVEGATATGKTEFALDLAEALGSEIISADSRQIYRLMDVGTAKPPLQVLQQVKHHLIDIIYPNEEYSAGRFAKEAAEIIASLSGQRKEGKTSLPIIAGGTGFYIQALLEGLFDAPPVNEDIRKELDAFEREKGSGYLHGILEKLDAASAARIHPNDAYRLKRALEVWIATGKGISSHWTEQAKQDQKYDALRILLTGERELLYTRINERMEQMVAKGLIEEIKKLLETGYEPTDPGLSSVGYKEFIPFILGNCSFFECLEEAKKNSRHYAKRQMTWYRKIEFDITVSHRSTDVKEIADIIRKRFALQ